MSAKTIRKIRTKRIIEMVKKDRSLQNNEIAQIDLNAFSDLKFLNKLDLRDNLLRDLN